MTDVDFLLSRLASSGIERDLSALEIEVASRIQAQDAARKVGGVKLQMVVVGVALVLGFAVAHVAGIAGMPGLSGSETVVLSDDSVLAPSVELEGGI